MNGTLKAIPKGTCLNALKQAPCHWPRCQCRVDLVYTTTIKIPRPRK